jgi:hypothetical protein
MKFWFIVALTFILSSTAFALDFKVLPKANHEGRPILTMTGTIQQQAYPRIKLSSKTIIVISSQGGNPTYYPQLEQWFLAQIKGSRPTVIVRPQCASTCIMWLALLNDLAGRNRIELIIDAKTALSFHGCWDNQHKQYSKACSLNMIKYVSKHGVETRWLNEHILYFQRPTGNYIIHHKAEDTELRDSGLLDHARIEDFTYKLLQ